MDNNMKAISLANHDFSFSLYNVMTVFLFYFSIVSIIYKLV